MIYFVTNQRELFTTQLYKIISVDNSIDILRKWNYIQFDTETLGRDCHVGRLLLAQFGNIDKTIQIIVDCTTIDIKLYKEVLEDKYLIGQNLKFDLQWLYNFTIIPRKVYDTMIVEQLLYLGYPPEYKDSIHGISYGLQDIAKRRLNIFIDKTVRGQIQWRGIDDSVIKYAANDVVYLYDIMLSQLRDCKIKDCILAAKLECDFVPVIAYMEWCGIHLDETKWKAKMANDKKNLDKSIEDLNRYVCSYPNLKEFTYVNLQGDLFTGFDTTPKCTINWKSSAQVLLLFEELGIKCSTIDPKTKTSKKSINEKVIAPQQKNFPIIELYLNFKEAEKLVDSFGQKFLDFVNPATGRIHSTFHQFGTDTGRLSSTSPNLQQLPKDALTRSCFVAEKGNKWISCDYSGQESFIMASLSNDSAMLDELLRGSGDLHSLTARMVFEEIPDDTPLKEIKTKYHDLRQKAKGYEFCFNYGGNASTLVKNYGIDENYAKSIYDNYMSGFDGLCRYQKNQRDFVNRYGYIILNKLGLRAHIYDFSDWEYLKQNNPREYRQRKAASEKQAINYKIQGSGAAMWKLAMVKIFNYIKKNNYLNIVKLCVPVHDNSQLCRV